MGPLDPAVDPGEALAANPKASALLAGVPAGARGRFEEKLLAGMHEQRVAGAAEEAARALRRDRAVELLRGAIARRDGTSVQQVLAAVGEDEGARVWPRAAAGLGIEPGDLEYPPPAPGGTAGSAPLLDLGGYLDAEADLAGALPGGGEAEAVLSRLPAGVRSRVEGRLAERLEAERVSRWVDKLRGAAGGGAGSGPVGGSVLEMPEARRLLGLLPPGIRDRVGTAAGRLLDGEAVERLAATARRLVEQDRAADLLRAALGLGDGDGADAILEAVGAALEVADETGLERLVQRVTQEGTAGLAGTGPARGAGAGGGPQRAPGRRSRSSGGGSPGRGCRGGPAAGGEPAPGGGGGTGAGARGRPRRPGGAPGGRARRPRGASRFRCPGSSA